MKTQDSKVTIDAEKLAHDVAELAVDVQLTDLKSIQPHPLNPRKELAIDSMVSDFERTGFYDTNFPIVVHFDKKPTISKTGIVTGDNPTLLRGHRRTAAAKQILETKPELAAKVFPNGLIPLTFVYGLTLEKQLKIVNDHSNTEKELSFFEAVSNALALIGKYTEQTAAAILGVKSRDLIQNAKRISVMPKYVLEALKEGKIKRGAVKKLYDAGNEDAGKERGMFANGDKFKAAYETAKVEAAGGTDENRFTDTERAKHVLSLIRECPPLDAIFAALTKGKKESEHAVQAAQKLAEKLGVDPMKEPEEDEAEPTKPAKK